VRESHDLSAEKKKFEQVITKKERDINSKKNNKKIETKVP